MSASSSSSSELPSSSTVPSISSSSRTSEPRVTNRIFSFLAADPYISGHFPPRYFVVATRVFEEAPREDVPRLGFEIEAGSNRVSLASSRGVDKAEMKTDSFLRALKKTPMTRDAGFHPTIEPGVFAKDLRKRIPPPQYYKIEYVSDPFPLTPDGKRVLVRNLHTLAALRESRGGRDLTATVRYHSELTDADTAGKMKFRHTFAPFGLTFQVTVGVNTAKLLADDAETREGVVRCFSIDQPMIARITTILTAAVEAEKILTLHFPELRGIIYNPYGIRLSLLLYLVQLEHFFSGSKILPKDWLSMNFKGGSSTRACGLGIPPFFFFDRSRVESAETEVQATLLAHSVSDVADHFRLELVGMPGMNFDTMYFHGRGIDNFICGGNLYTVVEARKSNSPLAVAVERIAGGSSNLDELNALLEKIL